MLDENVFYRFVHGVEFKYFNPFEYVRVTRQNLTHWQQPGVSYFLTYHLADAMPAVLLNQWKQERAIWLSFHPEPWTPEVEDEYHRRFSSQMERWLDAGHGSCVLRRPEVRAEVEESFRYFEGVRYQSFSWVIMPNHVHLLVMLHPDWTLEKVLFTWKRRTSGRINELCGTEGQQWQHDYFDRIIRDGQHFDNVVRYIRRNPVKAKLREGEYTLWESDEVKRVMGSEGRSGSAPRIADHRH
ncbi:transposase [Roseimicrobium gellanilyticum]|uniref:transposase n=1 Tax=Roseimicrobium gellanilyticum TaxID=748857 RepID=UPI000DEB8061|nr:transposase [Roseimicrobium gellanilyticum]